MRLTFLLIYSFFLVTSCSGSGGAQDQSTEQGDVALVDQNTPLNQDGNSLTDDSRLPTDNIDDLSGSTPIDTPPQSDSAASGYYRISAIPDNAFAGELLRLCRNTMGELLVADGRLTGFASVYDLDCLVDERGQIMGTWSYSGASIQGALDGQIDAQGGRGLWSQPGACYGDWVAESFVYPSPAQGEAFTLADGSAPAVLEFRFNQDAQVAFSNNGVQCVDAEGAVRLRAQDNTDVRVRYIGFAETSLDYRWDVDLTLDLDSGEVVGNFRYDPIGTNGSLTGDLYFAGSSRVFLGDQMSAYAGCNGTWEFRVVGGKYRG